jgi:superfamily II DNA helicase RecQ
MCYSLVPAISPGLVLVVSPLIALMQDQVQSLRARGLRADHLSSSRSPAERQRLLADLEQRQPATQASRAAPRRCTACA